MTYTNGYTPQNAGGASAYSPFNRTSGAAPSYAGYPNAVPTNAYGAAQPSSPSMGSDAYLPPANAADIDTLSGTIDNKIAQIRQAFSGGAPAAAPTGAPSAPAVPEAEIKWALELETKVKTQNYQPTAQETAQYEDIARRLSAPQQAPAQAPAQTAAPAAPAVPESDIKWALELETKVKTQNYQPNQQETARYEDIARRLSAPQQAPAQAPAQTAAPAAAPPPEADLRWALDLENKVKTQNYQPTQQETAKYEDIARKLAASQQPAAQPVAPGAAPAQGARNWADWGKPFSVPAAPSMPLPIAGPNGQAVMNVPTSLRGAPQQPPAAMLNQAPGTQAPAQVPGQPAQAGQLPANVSQQEVQWALQLEERVNKQNYQPNQQEMTQYQNIAQRLAAGQQQAPAAAPAQMAAPQMPAAPAQPQFQAAAPQAPAQAPPAQGQSQLPPGVSPQEVQWALDLENKVKSQNYQPNPQELAAYQNLAQRLQQAPPQQAAAPQMPQAPQAPQMPAQPQMPQAAQMPSQQELQWATQLQQRAQQGYQPSQQEMANFQSIAQRAQAAQQAPQATLPQYQVPTPQPVMMAPTTQPVQIVPQNFPMVQSQTPQMLVPPTPMPPLPGPQPQFQQQGQPGQMPTYMAPPGQQQPGGPQKPGFMDKLKTAWGTLWS